jgi:hypothetical protein
MFVLTNHPDSKETWDVSVSCSRMSSLLDAMDADEPTSIPVPSPSIQKKEAILTVELLKCMDQVRVLNEELCSSTSISTDRLGEIIVQVTKASGKVHHLKTITTFDWISPNPEVIELVENVYSPVNAEDSLLVYTIARWKDFKRTDDPMYYCRKTYGIFPSDYTYDDFVSFMKDNSRAERFLYIMKGYNKYGILRNIKSLLTINDNFPIRSWWRLYAHEDSIENSKNWLWSSDEHKSLLNQIQKLNPVHPDLDWLIQSFE